MAISSFNLALKKLFFCFSNALSDKTLNSCDSALVKCESLSQLGPFLNKSCFGNSDGDRPRDSQLAGFSFFLYDSNTKMVLVVVLLGHDLKLRFAVFLFSRYS